MISLLVNSRMKNGVQFESQCFQKQNLSINTYGKVISLQLKLINLKIHVVVVSDVLLYL